MNHPSAHSIRHRPLPRVVRRKSRLALRLALRPVIAALAAWVPLASLAAGPVHIPIPTPPTNAVPVPGATWRTYGTGNTAGPINLANSAGGVDQTINQTSQRAIYNWQSFDIGAASSVTFDMALTGSSALNRVTGSATPSQIFGRLAATNGGELYLINANGILFGRGAIVNTGSLIASALDVTDANFKAALLPAITATNTFDAVAFQYTGDAANFTDPQNFVQVDPGATITVGNGGRVYLFAKNVVNAGSITAPDGQVAMGAGSEIFLRLPSSHPEIYATQDSSQLPVLRGLLVEVGDKYDQNNTLPADVHTGTVTNVLGGSISVPRGNATLVGMAVNQMGRISATTSVSENGSIFLRAEGDAQVDSVNANFPVVAQKSGTLTLGPGSSTDILPDTQLVDGKAPTSTDNAGFLASRIDLVGKTVELQSGAEVIAPGADVNLRAETAPTLAYTQQATPDPDARIVLDPGAIIDVSGTTDATASVDRYFITTDLLTSNDLANSPLQKDGILYRSHVTIDVREGSKILGDLSRYRDAIPRTVAERLSTGGHVTMFAPGAVLLSAGSTVNVSGGQMTFTGATVKPTELLGADGTLWNLNDAPADQLYVLGLNLQNANSTRYNRWGAIATPGMTTTGILEPGYVQGQAAGSLSINAPTVIELGTLKASTTAGTRQTQGLDPIAGMGQLFLGDAAGFDRYEGSQPTSATTLLPDFTISQDGPIVPELLWETLLTGDLPTSSGMSLATFQDAGFGSTTISARNDVTLEAGLGLTLPDHASLTLQSAVGTVNLGGNITAHDGSISLLSQFGATNVGSGSHIDLSGHWINQFVDQALEDTSATAGGSFSARGERGVSLGAQSVIDVSGGASVSQGGTITGGNAGSITLLAGRTDTGDPAGDPAAQRQLVLGGTLLGDAMQGATGGSLSLRAPSIRVGTAAEGDAAAALTLDPTFLAQGGFSSYTLDGIAFLDVASGTTVAPTRQAWYVNDSVARYAPTGSRVGDVLALGNDPAALPPAVSLALRSSGLGDVGDAFSTGGTVTVGAGSHIELVPGATFSATGGESVAFDGTLVDHGGKVTLTALGNGDPTRSSYVWVGAGATIDVSGTTLVTPTQNGLVQGRVQDGGDVSLVAAGGNNHMGASLVVQEGARIDLDGGHGTLDVNERTRAGNAIVHETLDGDGGTLTLVTTSDLLVEGTVTAHGGGASAAGGAVDVQLLGARDDFTSIGSFGLTPAVLPDLQLQQAATHVTSTLTADGLPSAAEIAANNDAGHSNATFSAGWFAGTGASDLDLAAAGRLHAVGDVDLQVARNLVIDTPALAVDAGRTATLRGATTLVGNTSAPSNPNNALQLTPPVAESGAGTLTIAGTDVILDGDLVTQGAQTFTISAAHDLQLRSSLTANANEGTLHVAGDVVLAAGQVYPATGQSYTLDTTDPATGLMHDVTISGGDASLSKPLSAGGSFTVKSATIEQDGVVRAPFGAITLSATDALTLGDGSETSISGAGLVVAYGTTVNGATDWIAPGATVTAPITALPGKTLALNAGTLTTQAGAKVDLSGGGAVVAYEFVPGPGGSQDIFAGGTGAYAIVPGASGLAPYDPTFTGYAALGQQIVIGAGALAPAGTYTLLPARYALLPGAFLVTPVAGTPLALGTAVTNPDGSVLVGARTASANTGFASSASSTWRVQTSAQAQKSSEVVATSADTFFARLAANHDTVAPRGAADGGVLDVTAGAAQIAGSFDFQPAKDAAGHPVGYGGVAAFAADHIVVTDDPAGRAPGTLSLTAQELDAMAPASLLLGATIGGAGTQGTLLEVTAQTVTFANTRTPLQVADVIAAATDGVTVNANAAIVSAPPSPLAAPISAFQVEGDGAALRVADTPGATLTRTGSDGVSGALLLGAGAHLDAGTGSLTLDGSATTIIAGDAQLRAADITLAAGLIQVGAGNAPRTLVLNDALLAQVDNAEHLTLRGYDRIAFLADTRIAGGALESVTLDTPKLLSAAGDASVDAGEIVLANTVTADQQHGAAGDGTLTLHADATLGSGRLVLDDGIVSIVGTQGLVLDADRALVLNGGATLTAGGDVLVQAPIVLAQVPTSGLTSVADATISAVGTVRFQGGGTADTATPGAGAAFTVNAASIVQGSDIELPSGQVTLNAASGDVSFLPGSRTQVAGHTVTIDGTPVATNGGTLAAAAAAGNVVIDAGATLDVSAAAAAAGGTLSLSAPLGTLALDGTLLGTSYNSATGATLVLDAQYLPPLEEVAALQQLAYRNFGGSLDLRQRGEGTVSLDSGTTLVAHQVAIDNDGGAIVLAGTIDASGGQAARIAVAARDDLTVAAGAVLSVHASGGHVSGGTIDLTTTDGTLALQAGAMLDLRADGAQRDPDVEGGRLTLRAPRTGVDGDNPGGTDVAIASIGATVQGAASVDVQAVQVYDGVTHITNDLNDTSDGTLQLHTLYENEQNFLGAIGNNADRIAARLARGNSAVESILVIHPEDEIRSNGDLTITTSPSWSQLATDDWVLHAYSADDALTSIHAGDASITLRAAGNLDVQRTISAGFAATSYKNYDDERLASVTSTHAGEIRLVAGADMGAADALRTNNPKGQLSIGRTDQDMHDGTDDYNIVAIRSTTGDIALAAGGDIDLHRGHTLVYTTGRDVVDDDASAVRNAMSVYPEGGGFAFDVGAGDISVRAGGSVIGNDTLRDNGAQFEQAEELSSFRAAIVEGTAFYNDGTQKTFDGWNLQTGYPFYTGVEHGVFSFGGGNIDVRAGADVLNLVAVSPSTAFLFRDADGNAGAARIFAGGNVSVAAGRDVVNGLYEAGGPRLDVKAGRDFTWQPAHDDFISEPGLRLITEDGTIAASARRDATFGYVADAYYTQDQALTGLDGDSSTSVQAAGGNVSMLLTQESPFNSFSSMYNDYVTARFSVTAPGGSLRIGDGEAMGLSGVELDQIPVQQSSFDLLAAGDVTVAHSGTFTINVQGTADLSHGAQFIEDLSQGVPHSSLDEGDRTPVHIAAATGDVSLAQLLSARPIRIDAGEDVILPAYVGITHQPTGVDGSTVTGETSSIQAGRDVLLEPDYRNLITGGVNVAGPGELLVLAGRNVDLGSGAPGSSTAFVSGLLATGNTTNGLLPAVASNITVIAGLRADGTDYTQAARMGFAVLGANGLTDHAGDLYALLSATGDGVVALGTSQASAFSALSPQAQLAQVRTLVGASFYDAQIANYVRSQPGQSGLSDAQALAAFAGLSATKQAAAPGVVLAHAFAGRSQAQRDGFIAELAGAAGSSTYPAALLAYMQRLQGATLTLADALAAFEALPLVEQIPLLDSVLIAEVRTQGRAAAAASGTAQEDAYNRGYRTIAALFPVDRPDGSIEMPEATVKTLQQGSITLLTPGGGVDAGGLSASTVSPNNLGIVTVAGGDISAVVRDDFLVNQSRVFTLAPGDLLIWSSEGNIDAGRGAKTVVGAPAPVLRLDPVTGLLFLDTSGSFTGSGIAVLDPASTLDLYAPAGAINAGEAGIKSAGNAYFAAQTFIGADNLTVGGHSVGAPPPVNATATVALASAGNSLAANANQVADDQKEERRKRRLRRNLLIEFLGFGPAS